MALAYIVDCGAMLGHFNDLYRDVIADFKCDIGDQWDLGYTEGAVVFHIVRSDDSKVLYNGMRHVRWSCGCISLSRYDETGRLQISPGPLIPILI